eukprot:12054520-Karenia_brevis.AAC.1
METASKKLLGVFEKLYPNKHFERKKKFGIIECSGQRLCMVDVDKQEEDPVILWQYSTIKSNKIDKDA